MNLLFFLFEYKKRTPSKTKLLLLNKKNELKAKKREKKNNNQHLKAVFFPFFLFLSVNHQFLTYLFFKSSSKIVNLSSSPNKRLRCL